MQRILLLQNTYFSLLFLNLLNIKIPIENPFWPPNTNYHELILQDMFFIRVSLFANQMHTTDWIVHNTTIFENFIPRSYFMAALWLPMLTLCKSSKRFTSIKIH